MAKYYYHKYDKDMLILGSSFDYYFKYFLDVTDDKPYIPISVCEILHDSNISDKQINFLDILNNGDYRPYIFKNDISNWGRNLAIVVLTAIQGKIYRVGTQSGYLNVKRDTVTFSKGRFIETVKAEESVYPDNGFYSDEFWYVKGEKATIPINTNIGGVWEESEAGYINVNGVWKEIKEIHQMQNGAWSKLF